MQVIELVPKNRPLQECRVCKKLGYHYKRKRGNHYYRYTIHYNEPPIGSYSNGEPKYRSCYENSRVYDTIEEAIKAENTRREKEVPKFRTKSKLMVCPKCGKLGLLNRYHPNKRKYPDMINYLIKHGFIKGTWGKKGTTKKRDRCYLPTTFSP